MICTQFLADPSVAAMTAMSSYDDSYDTKLLEPFYQKANCEH